MSEPPRPLSRRALLRGGLLAGAVALTGGCGLDLGQVRWGQAPPPPEPTPGPDELARRRATSSAQRLEGAVAAALAVRPDLEQLLSAVAAEHAAHREALGPLGDAPPPSSSPAPVPADPVADLLSLELEAAGEPLADVVGVGPGLARLLASVAASRAVHASLLAGALGQPPPTAPLAPSLASSPDVTGDGADAALTALLAGEHAAVHTFAVLAARLADAEREPAVVSLEAHRLLVERLSQWLTDADLDVPPAAPGYQVPPLPDDGDALALAVTLEEQVAVLDASLVAASTDDLRAVAADLLVQRALAASAWRGGSIAFPGLPELA